MVAGDYDSAQGVIDAWAEGKPENSKPIEAAMQNPIIRHTTFEANENRVFVGLRFSW